MHAWHLSQRARFSENLHQDHGDPATNREPLQAAGRPSSPAKTIHFQDELEQSAQAIGLSKFQRTLRRICQDIVPEISLGAPQAMLGPYDVTLPAAPVHLCAQSPNREAKKLCGRKGAT